MNYSTIHEFSAPTKLVFGQGDKWLEILGCGMVHPNVIKYS